MEIGVSVCKGGLTLQKDEEWKKLSQSKAPQCKYSRVKEQYKNTVFDDFISTGGRLYNILKHKRQEESWYHLKGFEQE